MLYTTVILDPSESPWCTWCSDGSYVTGTNFSDDVSSKTAVRFAELSEADLPGDDFGQAPRGRNAFFTWHGGQQGRRRFFYRFPSCFVSFRKDTAFLIVSENFISTDK